MKIKIYNDNLEPNFWNKDMTLKTDVRLKLLKIVNDFYKSTEFKSEIIDILLLGSIVNFNWLPESDVDLHAVINIKEEGLDPEHFRKMLDSLGGKWNQDHDIVIHGHPVEVYIQDITEKNSTVEKARAHSSMFSLLKNEWLILPKYEKIAFDKELIKQKFHELKNQIDKVINDRNVNSLKQLMKDIKFYRNKGLEGNRGEFSTENLVFKALRHTGMLEKLKNSINSIYDRMVSIKESKDFYNRIINFEEDVLLPIIQETIDELEERDKPYIIIGVIDDNLRVDDVRNNSKNKIFHSSLKWNVDPTTQINWRYRSDINVLFWWDDPSESQLSKVREYLKSKYKIESPKHQTSYNTSDNNKLSFHDLDVYYKHGDENLTEVVDKNADFLLGWVKKHNLKVIGFEVNPNDETETHYNYLMGMPDEWRKESDSNLVRWRYRRDKNTIYWWSMSRGTEEERKSVEMWLKQNLNIKNPQHKIMYVPILDIPDDGEDIDINRKDAHGW